MSRGNFLFSGMDMRKTGNPSPAMTKNKLELRIKGPKNAILQGIQDIDGVVSAEIVRIREEGTVDIRLETDDETEVRGEIFRFCAREDYPIYMMKTDEINLEDIFLQVTGEREARRR